MKDREFILEKLNEAKALKLNKLHYVIPTRSYPSNADYIVHSRLIVILSGKKNAFLPLLSGKKNIQISQGDVLYCLPKSWELHEWSGVYEMLCIVPRKEYLRVSLYTNKTFSNKTRPASVFHHTGLPYPESMRHVFGALNSDVNSKDVASSELLVKSIISMAEYQCKRKNFNPNGQSQILYNRIRNWITNSFQEDINREIVAKVFGISPGYLSQLFKKYSGETFQTFLTTCRMDYARELLETTNLNSKQIAHQAGYQNYVHFVRFFRERNGLSPQKYRQFLKSKN